MCVGGLSLLYFVDTVDISHLYQILVNTGILYEFIFYKSFCFYIITTSVIRTQYQSPNGGRICELYCVCIYIYIYIHTHTHVCAYTCL